MQTKLTIATLITGVLIQGSALADYFADFSKGEVKADFAIRTERCDNNPHYKGSYRLLQPNRSYVEGTFAVTGKPKEVLVTLKHLSSLSKGSKLDGESPVAIIVNGNPVIQRLDPGSHGYVKDTFEITKYIREGNNTIRIQYLDGSTHYWIKWMLIETN